MPKFSVKKPYTVFVAMIAILVLGIVAYTRMTPDLMPNLDLPYVIVVTTYPGATPEKVETEISKPLEQSFATLDNLESIASSSSENYSLIMMEFSDDVNMDTITVDILQSVDAVSGAWDEVVGTPYILKINPNLLPAAVTAVGMEGMDTIELSTFVEEEIKPELEGVEGIASIDAYGLVDTQVNVLINQEKIDKVNEKVKAALDEKFKDAKKELDDGEAEISRNKAKLRSGKSELAEGKEQLAVELGAGAGQITTGNTKLIEAKVTLQNKKTEIENKKTELETAKKNLTELKNNITQARTAKSQLESGIEALKQARDGAARLTTAKAGLEQLLAAVQGVEANTMMDDAAKAAAIAGIMAATGDENMAAITSSAQIQAQIQQIDAQLAQVDAQLAAAGTDRAGLDAAIATYQTQLDQVNAGLAQIDSALASQGLSEDTLDASLAEIDTGLTQINAGLVQIEGGLAQLEAGEMQLAEAQSLLTQQQTGMILQLSEATTQMLVGESQLTMAEKQLEQGLEQFDDGKEQAYKQADLDHIITMDMVSQILFAQNFSMPAGYVTDAGVQYMVSVGDVLADDEEIGDLLLMDMDLEGLDPIYLSDVADVFISDNSDSVYANIDGTNGVMLSFTKQSTVATAEASKNLSAKLKELSEEYEGFHYSMMMDQGDYIYMIINAILKSLLLGAVFAILILFLFLKDLRPTFITLCSIPISVIFAFVLMYFSGVTLNMISMSGLAIAVGMLVDNSVVVIENTYRLIHKGESALAAAVAGAEQVAGAVASSTLTTICVFVPIIFVDGLTRQIFQDLALTIAYSLLASLAIALTLVPAMSQGMLKKTEEKKSPIMDRLLSGYEKLLTIALRFKPVTLLIAFLLLVVSALLIIEKGFIYMPEMSTNQVSATIEMPEEASFSDLQSISDLVVGDVKEMHGVVSVGAMAEGNGSGGGINIMSLGSGGGTSDVYTSTVYIMLTEEEKIDTSALAKQIEALGDTYDCTITVDTGSMSSMMSALGGSGVTMYLFGDDAEQLQETAKQVASIVEDVKGTADVSDGMEEATPTYKVVVDKEKAMAKGLTVAQIYQELSGSMTTEKTATSITMEANTYDVVVKEGEAEDTTLRDIRNHKFTVTDQDGEESTVYLKDIADFEEGESLPTIRRNDQRRYMEVSAGIEEGYNVTLVTQDVKDALSHYELPKGMRLEFDGQNEAIFDAMKDLVLMILLGIVLVYLVMVAQFQSLKGPFIIIFTIPLAFTGGFLGLLICNMNISIVSMMGFVMLSGIIVNNGIVLVDFINQLRREGMEQKEAIIEAGKTRMRPILMTTMTTILGLFDMALSRQTGSEMMQPVAVVCIGGLSYATLMTLFVVPVIYDLFYRRELRIVKDDDLILDSDKPEYNGGGEE